MKVKLKPQIGAMAEFTDLDGMIEAIRALRGKGYTRLDLYAPFPVHGSDELLGLPRSKLPYVMFAGGAIGASGAYFLQWWMNAYDYVLNVGGRPAHAGPAFVIVTFEMGILFAGLSAFAAVFLMNGLPRLWHPVFEIDGFERASIDRFWVSVDTDDPKWGAEVRADLEAQHPLRVVFLAEEPAKKEVA